MSVLIKGMDMPKSCKECPFSDHEAWCLVPGDWRKRYYCPDNKVSDDCPLVDVPAPHGKLIDADELIHIAKKWTDHPDPYISKRNKDLIIILEKADAVIEAEE